MSVQLVKSSKARLPTRTTGLITFVFSKVFLQMASVMGQIAAHNEFEAETILCAKPSIRTWRKGDILELRVLVKDDDCSVGVDATSCAIVA